MNKQHSTILSIKNIHRLKYTLKTLKYVVPLSQYPSNYFNAEKQSVSFVSLEKIKEFYSVVVSHVSLIFGLHTSIQKIINIHSHYPLPYIIIDSIKKFIPYESFQSVRLLDIISTNQQHVLLRLVLSLLKTKVLIVKHNTQYWMNFEEYMKNEIHSYQSIPLSLRFNLDIHTHHVITVRDIQSYRDPSFAIIGIVQLNAEKNKIIDVSVYIYKNKEYYDISQQLTAFKQRSYPLNVYELHSSAMKQTLSLPFLSKIEHGYFLESLIMLLHPNIV